MELNVIQWLAFQFETFQGLNASSTVTIFTMGSVPLKNGICHLFLGTFGYFFYEILNAINNPIHSVVCSTNAIEVFPQIFEEEHFRISIRSN